MLTVRINSAKGYDVLIGSGLLAEAGLYARGALPKAETVVIVCDDTVNGLYGDFAERSLGKVGFKTARFVFESGEKSKNISTLEKLLEAMAGAGLTRSDAVFALGGGVTGDIAGFAAAVYMRGISFVQAPTTLLAMADSSVGGKTAIDIASAKNLAGAFHQPSLVLCDTDALKTLPGVQFEQGVVECLKAGILADEGLARDIAAGALGSDALERTLTKCIKIKAAFVEADETDLNERQLLNLGHTVGHAVEALSGYSVFHGHAVSIGMAAIARASWANGICGRTCAERIVDMLKGLGLPTDLPFLANEIASAAMRDKKRAGGKMTLVVPNEIGKCSLLTINAADFEGWLDAGRGMEF